MAVEVLVAAAVALKAAVTVGVGLEAVVGTDEVVEIVGLKDGVQMLPFVQQEQALFSQSCCL